MSYGADIAIASVGTVAIVVADAIPWDVVSGAGSSVLLLIAMVIWMRRDESVRKDQIAAVQQIAAQFAETSKATAREVAEAIKDVSGKVETLQREQFTLLRDALQAKGEK